MFDGVRRGSADDRGAPGEGGRSQSGLRCESPFMMYARSIPATETRFDAERLRPEFDLGKFKDLIRRHATMGRVTSLSYVSVIATVQQRSQLTDK